MKNNKSLNFYDSYQEIVKQYLDYINNQRLNKTDFAFSSKRISSPFARCFAVFGIYNFSNKFLFDYDKDIIASCIIRDLKFYINEKYNSREYYNYKSPSQLLCFSLTALYCLERVEAYKKELKLIIEPYLKINIKEYFLEHKVFTAEPKSGNFAMFLAIILIYSRDWLEINTQDKINYWVDCHLGSLNNFNLWGNKDFFAQFQNAYHQYEIFDYLNINIFENKKLIDKIIDIQDRDGHFGPLPGGGGCYDFDAIKILTLYKSNNENTYDSLLRFAKKITFEQNKDGGFSESYDFYPLRIKSQLRFFIQFFKMKNIDKFIPLAKQYFYITLKNPVFNNNHFCDKTLKKWSDSDLWNSWFRVLALTNSFLYMENNESSVYYKRIKFPGIGFSN